VEHPPSAFCPLLYNGGLKKSICKNKSNITGVLIMLKTNSKKAKENIQQYIIDNFTPEGYTDETITGFENVATFILNTFRSEKYGCKEDYKYYCNCELDAFVDWCSGLPSLLDTCYYYNRSAADDLAVILEETDEEKNRFTEDEAEWALTYLIYSELKRGETK
jgi:hypothetical protein